MYRTRHEAHVVGRTGGAPHVGGPRFSETSRAPGGPVGARPGPTPVSLLGSWLGFQRKERHMGLALLVVALYVIGAALAFAFCRRPRVRVVDGARLIRVLKGGG